MLSKTPKYINWNYTYKCNFNCPHCYSRAPFYPEELSESDYEKIVKLLIDKNVFRVGFGGGEPLIRKDFINTIETLSKNGVLTYFTTNATFLDDEKINKLSKTDLSFITFSLDSLSPNIHDKIRGKGNFNRVIDRIKKCSEFGIECKLSITLMNLNSDSLEGFLSLLKDYNIKEINFKFIRPSGNAKILESITPLKTTDKIKMINQINHFKEKGYPVTCYGPENHQGCSCGNTTLTLRANGDLSICPYSESTLDNILNENALEKSWSSAQGFRNIEPQYNEECLGEKGTEWPMLNKNVEDNKSTKYSNKIIEKVNGLL